MQTHGLKLELQSWRASRNLERLVQQRWPAVVLTLIVTGLGAAAAGLLFKTGVGWLGSWRLSLLETASPWLVLPSMGAVGGLLSAVLISTLAPTAAGSGIPQVMRFLSRQSLPMNLQVAIVKLLAGILAIGSGFPLGPEGPAVQMGSSVGWQMARWFKAPPSLLRVIVAAGGGAGIAAVFHAPLGGFFYAIEELLRKSGPILLLLVLGTAFAGSFWADVMGLAGFGEQSAGIGQRGFQISSEYQLDIQFLPKDLIYLVALGIVVGLLAELYTRYVVKMQSLGQRFFSEKIVIRMLLGGIALGCLYAALPADFRNNAALQHAIVDGHVELSKAVGIFTLLFFATGLAAATGAPGGLFAPMLTLGGALGLTAAGIAEHLSGHAPSTYVFAGMAAFIAACSRTPITAVFLVFALTKDLLILKPLFVCAVVSFVISRITHEHSIYQRQLALQSSATSTQGEMKLPGTPLSPREL
ncbi:ClC family H(+)/Cl(-) exchange transporter [Synechococcus sp. W4D4]|uniref:ClC family H(+)/Cl(-) exchange transporter n=1 Tax=Synechococcus sp. W4D4 TaxID=3392294 RepID=UPI0039E8F90A